MHATAPSNRTLTLVWLTSLVLLVCYAFTLRGVAEQWWNDEDMGHGFIVPAVALWILWRERARWSKVPVQPSIWGLPILCLGAAMQVAAELGAGLFTSSLALLVSVAGAVVCLAGLARLRAWAFPMLLGLFMLPKLAFVYNQATLPLQLLASRLAASLLSMVGLGVIRAGNILDVGGHQIAVAEACNGVRYLLSLGFVGVMVAYLTDSRPWMRVALLGAAVPLAIVANAVRVAAAAWAPVLESGTLHAVSGFVIFAVCLAALMAIRRVFHEIAIRCHA